MGKAVTSNIGTIQTVLDVVGMIPGIGEAAYALNGAIYLARGDELNAGLSFAACVPVAGSLATVGKLVNKGDNLFDAGKGILKASDALGEVKTQNHHWWPIRGGGAKNGATVKVQSAGPNLHTAKGGLHPDMNSYPRDRLRVSKVDDAWEAFKHLDFEDQQALFKDFYQRRGMDMPEMIKPGILK